MSRLTPALVVVGLAIAPDRLPAQDAWRFTVTPSFMAPFVDGIISLPPTAPVHANPADVFQRLQFGAMLTVEATRGPWTIAVDGYYTNLAQPAEGVDLTAGIQQGAVELAGLRRLAPWAEVLLGVRANFLGASLRGTANGSPVDADVSVSWAQPIVGGRATVPGTGRWDLSLRGDVGGFGIGSDFAWQIHPIVGYRVSATFMPALGYRYAGVDYENAEQQFHWDMDTFGPELRLGFSF